MALTNTIIRTAKPHNKPYKMADEKGMFLYITPAGSKLWRLKYRFDGKEKLLSLGAYPDVSLKDARASRDDARKLHANRIDPCENRKVQKTARVERAANSFEVVAREWFSKYRPGWSTSHSERTIRRLENDVFPWIGGRPIAEIGASEVLDVLRRIEGRGTLDTAHRAHQNCSQVFRYAVATGRALRDPTPDLRGALPAANGGHFAAITEPQEVGALLRAIDGFKGTFIVLCALKLAPMLFVRPGELRQARWQEFDLDRAEWKYWVTKTKTDHLVPLASQAVKILKELHALSGHTNFVFPGARSHTRAMSDAAVNAALRRMGYDTQNEMTGHGFRAMARTILHQEIGIAPEIIEHQLAHRVSDTLGAAYNRTKFLKERRRMMQQWADYLDLLRSGSKFA
ncbi:integrase arm-type DNA-binding domain-containing protein [Nitrosospira sp. Nsp13]|uniref:tyrosine-type recombinase/integrase n=1 Tax=Nitrosospira sp. Nsp13 TaxID=1855332 RepID=UPI00088E851B|nr:integrase arm-type DNA-binding domain-containing protein [Nitrosospira sp. Nsp13]SCX87530.1 Integrase [Nitrosospira sp. Nsp13]